MWVRLPSAIADGNITDYGKVTEFGSFRLFRSEIDGNIYSANRSGYFYRINTDTQQIEELGIFFEKDYEPYSTEKHVQLDYITDGKDGNIYLRYIFGYNLYRYNIKENKLEKVGDGRPEDLELAEPNQYFGLSTDDRGVLWYTLASHTAKYDWTSAYLIRWDVLNGEKPRNMGIIGTMERTVNVMAEMHCHNGILYFTGGNHLFDVPGMFAIDIKKLEETEYDLNEDNVLTPMSRDILNYMHLDEPEKYYPYGKEEFLRQYKNIRYFVSYSEGFAKFMSENPMEIPHKKITPYPLWRKYGYKNSSVYSVSYDGDFPVIEFGGKNGTFCYRGKNGSVEKIGRSSEAEKTDIPKNKIPKAVGRYFRAEVTASTEIFEGKHLVGTKDGLLFIWDGENAFNLGSCPNTSGEVRQIAYCRKTETAYGIIGSYNDISIVFSFDKINGVKYLGRAHFNIESGLYLNCELSSIAVNDDGTKLLIGSNENMGCAYDIVL